MIGPHAGRNWALVVGNEREGISQQILQLADKLVFIPQAESSMDSINVGHATAICLFELAKSGFSNAE